MTAAIVTLNATIGEIEELLTAGKTVEDVARELQEPRVNVLAVWHRMRGVRQDIGAPAPIKPPTLVPPVPASASLAVQTLIAAAERSTQARTRKLGVKFADLALELRHRLADERETAEAAAKEQAEREEAVAEVTRLESQLAAAREKAGVTSKRRASSSVPREKKPLTDSQRERLAKMRAAQVGDWPCRKGCGRISKTPSGRSAHERHCAGKS